MEDTKVCSRCKQKREFSLFNKCKHGVFGLHGHCRDCQKQCKREWYLNNREGEIKKSSEYSKLPSTKESRKTRYKQDHEYRKKSLLKNRYRRRLEPAKIKQRANEQKRRSENPNYRIGQNLRGRLRTALIQQGVVNKSAKTFELVGRILQPKKKGLLTVLADAARLENEKETRQILYTLEPCEEFVEEPVELKNPKQYAEFFGLSEEEAKELLK